MKFGKLSGGVVATVAMTLTLVGCGGADTNDNNKVTAEQVSEKCTNGYTYLRLAPDKKSVEFSYSPTSLPSLEGFQCVLRETRAPSSIEFKIKNTRPTDATQTATWDGWDLTWSYGGRSNFAVLLFAEK